jgi:streptogrisin C
MKRISFAGACVIAAITIGAAVAPASYAYTPKTSANVSTLLQRETEVLTRQGISAARASQAIDVQSEIARTEILSKIEAALGSAYAGAWFEPTSAQLHLGVTSPASRLAVEETVARAGLTGDVVATPVRSTWEQLLATEQRWNGMLASAFARGEVKLTLSPQLNAVSVTLSSAAPATERAALEREASASNIKVYVFVVPSSQLEITQDRQGVCKTFVKGKAYCEKPITAGVTIVESAGKPCTAGPLAIGKGNESSKTYVLTAGHCLVAGGEPWFGFTPAGVKGKIGPVVKIVNGLPGDYGDILIEQPGFWSENGNPSIYALTAEWKLTESTKSYPVRGERTPVVGFTNCHEGQTTGQSCGQIKAVSGVVYININGVKKEGLVEDKGANAEGGDSGGPWLFIESNNEVLMEGTLVGATTITNTTAYYEPLKTALEQLKLELLTTANETRRNVGPFLHRRSNSKEGVGTKIEEKLPEGFNGEGGSEVLNGEIGGAKIEIMAKSVQVKGTMYNNARQGQINMLTTYHEPKIVKPELKGSCEVKIGTNNEAKTEGHLAWKAGGGGLGLIITSAPIEEGAKELPKGAITTVTLTGAGCGLLVGKFEIKESQSVNLVPEHLEEWSTKLIGKSPGAAKQEIWNGIEFIGVTTGLTFGGNPATLTGEVAENTVAEEVAAFEK